MCFGLVDTDGASSLFEDLADLFEQAAEALKRNYPDGGYVDRERQRAERKSPLCPWPG
jgi:hypothetical protein